MADSVTPHLDDLIRELSGEITQIHRWMAEEAGLNTTDLMALFFIRNGEGQVTPKQLAENLGLTSGATAILLSELEHRLRHALNHVTSLADLEAAVGACNPGEPFPRAALRVSRGKHAGMQQVSLPDGFLERLDDDSVPEGADEGDDGGDGG